MKTLQRKTNTLPERPPVFLQFGSGNFLRAFVDWMVQRWNDQTDFSGGVIMLKSSPRPSAAFDQLRAQGGLYHVLTRGQQDGQLVDQQQRIDVVERLVHPWENPTEYLALAEIASLRFIVSNTTEAGIQFDATDRWEDHPASSFPGKLTQLLYRRFTHFAGALDRGFIFLPCELIPNNGTELRDCILRYAEHWQLSKDFIRWIHQANTFCTTLVDRIVPGFPHQEEAALRERLGVKDKLMVAAEPYHLLVIDAPTEVAQQLPWPDLGLNVIFTDQLDDYRQQKVRILNGAHTAMVALGLTRGVQTVREAISDPAIAATLTKMLEEEIIPGIPLPEAEVRAYTATVVERFQNPFIVHRLADIALNSVAKFRTRLLPSLHAYYAAQEQPPHQIVQALAALVRLYRGDLLPLRDDAAHLAFFQTQWQQWEADDDTDQLAAAVLAYEAAWGQDLNVYSGLTQALGKALKKIKPNN
ncbi:MAG: tagaturonate reductase [Bacteroidota bacterium]